MPISRFPFFYNPNYYNRPYYNNHSNYHSTPQETSYINNSSNSDTNKKSEKENNLKDAEYKKNNSKSSINQDSYFFELFGLKLYSDDILLICLIIFLYQEGVKDDELFISLILLLLS